jgi:hypothetical protein
MLPRDRRISGFALLVLSVSTHPARAQSVTDDSVRVASARAALFSVPLDSPIRIRTVGQSILEGSLAARSDTDVVVRQRRDSLRASMTRIAAMWRREPNFKTGAIAGGVTGAVIGGLLVGFFAASLCDSADCHRAFVDGASVGVPLGGAIGAVIGLGVGAVTRHWEPFWP